MNTSWRAGATAVLALTIGNAMAPAMAGPSDDVITPIVDEDEREFDFKAGSATARDGSRGNAWSLGFGIGVNRWWFTELYALWHRDDGGERHGFEAWEWENKLQLVETGRYPVDVGLLLEVERARDRSEGYELRWGPLLQVELGSRMLANLNLLLEKHVHATEGTPAELGYQWQLIHRWQQQLEWGVQGFGEVGPYRHWEPSSEQTHIAGPALFGRLRVGERQAIKYNAAWLWGLNHHSPRRTLRVQAEYEF